MVSLSIGAVCGQMEVYLDEALIGTTDTLDPPFVCLLDLTVPGRLYTLTLRVVHDNDSGGICGPITLINALPDVLDN